MATGTTRRIGMTMAVLVGAAIICFTASPASACSFAFPATVTIEGSPQAGGTLAIGGSGFVGIDGDVSSMCGGTYDFVPASPVTLIVDFTTLSGPRSIALITTPMGPRIPHDTWKVGSESSYRIATSTPIPADATAVKVRADGWLGEPTTATIAGAVATTVPTSAPTTGTGPDATPATPVRGQANLTG